MTPGTVTTSSPPAPPLPVALPYFLPYQRAWINDDAQVAMIEKSRRTGLTYAESFRSVERRVKLGTDHLFASRTKETAREFIDYCKMWARVFNVAAADLGEVVIDEQDREAVKAFGIRFDNGARILALSSNADAFRGYGGDVTLDELAFHKDQRGVMKGGTAAAIVWGHQVRIISTHNGEGSFFNQLIQEILSGKRNWSLHRVTLIEAVAQGLAEAVRASRVKDQGERRRIFEQPDHEARERFIAEIRGTCSTIEEWDEEYMCVPNTDAGAFLSYDLIDGCVDHTLRMYTSITDLPPGKEYYFGYDVGRRHDLCVLWVTEKLGDVFYLRVLQVLTGEERRFSHQEKLIDSLLFRGDVVRGCIDQTGMGEQLAEQRVEKFPGRVEGVILSGPRKLALAASFKGRFEDRRYRIPGDDALREDLHKTRKVVTAGGNVRLSAESDEDGHADRFWAGALECEASGMPASMGVIRL